MSRLRSALVLGSLAIVACGEPPSSPTMNPQSAPSLSLVSSTGKYVVAFKKDAVPAGFADQVAALGGSVEVAYDGAGIAVVSGLSDGAAQTLSNSSDVSDMGPDELFQILEPNAVVEIEAVTDATPSSPSNPTTASRYSRQWNMRQIGADKAWAAGKLGSPAVKVAILDTGIDYLYPDLAGRVDLANSASFVTDDTPYLAAYFPTRHTSTDLHFHGTHVAATVASNSNIVAGVTTQTTLMAVKVLNVAGSGTTSGILAGIVFAADRGADIINMSLGNRSLPFDMKNKANKDFFNRVVDRAFKYAHSKGVTIVVAAGNEAQNLDVKQSFKPYCGAMHVICVSATGPTDAARLPNGALNPVGPWINTDALAGYSNYGLKMINVAAPGGNTGGSVWSACSTSSLQIPTCRTGIFILGASGTSMAAPHTVGLAALLIAEKGKGGATGWIRSTIENSADDLGAAGEDALYGHGRINVARALGIN